MFTLLALILSLWLTSCRFGYLGRDQAVTLNIATSLSLTGPTTVEASACSGPFSVTGVSSSGTTPATFDPSARFSIAGAGESEIFTDSSCSSGALGSEIPLLSGTNEADFYLKITRSSDITVTANSEGLTSASLPLTVLPGVPTKLAIYAPSTIGQYQCVRVTSQLLDAGGAVTAARNDLNVRLFALGGNGTLLYPDGTCTTPISNIPLLTGASGFSVYTLGPIPGSISLTFDPRTADITEGTETITVMAGSTPRLALTPPGGNVVAGNCIPLSARALTSDGSQLTVRSDIAVAITATGTTGQLYSNNACTTALPNNTATIPAFTTMGILYFRATVVTPTFTLTGSSSGFISATYSSAVIAAAPDKLLMLNAPSSARALACAGPVPLKLKDTFNNDALAVAKTTINLTATGTSGAVTKFYGPNDSTCAASVTAVNVNMSANTTQFYFSVQKADSSTLNANSTGLTGATTTVSILTAQGNPNILALTTNRPSPLAGECVAVTLTSQDSFGNPKEVNPTALTFNLSTNTVGSGFYSDGACGTGVTSVEMAVGTFQSSFFFKGTKADSTTTISASQLGAVPPLTGSLALNVLSAAPAQLQFANVPSQVVKTVCSGPVSIAVFDAHGNTTASSSAIAISLQATNGGKFYGDDACASMLSSTSIAAAQNSVGSLYFKGTVIGTMNLVGLGPNSISAATSSVQVLAPPATKLVLGGTSPVNAGDCVPIPVTSVDSTTNQPSIFDPVAVTLGSSSHNPSVFFSNSSCTTAASLLTLDSSPKGTIYFKDTIAEEVQVLATALSGPAEGNQTIVVKPGAPAQLVFDTAGTSTLIVNSCTGPYKIISQDGLGNLSPLSANTSVGFSTTGAQVKAYSDNLCTNANVQIGANESNTLIYLSSAQLGASTLTATVGGLSPGVRSWNVINPSVIVSSIIPNQGPPTGSSSVTISGSNFVSGVTVSVGGQPCTGVLFDNSGRIRCTTPAGTIGFATVIITNPSALSSTIVNGFQYVDSAVVATVTPNSGPIAGGTVISLTGSSFQLGSTVSIGGQPCLSVVIASGTNITCTTSPGNAGTVAVSVTSPNGQTGSLASGFRYFGSPAITAVNPTTGVETGGTTIVLNGSSLEPGGAVTVGGVNCTNLIVSPTIATCRTGVHLPGVVDIQFTNPDGLTATLANSFTYLGLPIITQILPNSGPTTGGTAINITGQNFDSQSIVQIDGSGCGNIRNLSATFLTCDTPAAADVGAVDVVITNRTGQIFTLAGGFTYTYPPPQVVAVVPTSGTAVGGNSVEIDGFNFRAGVSVLIGGTPCGNVNFVSANKITCTAGANSPGPADVVVANIPSGTTTVAGGYSYISAPMLTSVTPASGSTAGGTSVTIVGTQFLAGPTVLFDLAACINVVAVSATQITCTTPVHSAGNVTVTVTNTDLGTVSKPNAFVYAAPPSLSSIAPTSAPSNGGITLTLTGSNFTNGLSITVGGQTCTSPTMVNANQATCAMPAVSPGNAAVVLTNADGQTAILAGGLTVNFPPSIASFSPTHVPEQGGAILTITGAHFVTGVTVTVDENNCTPVTMISATQIQCPTPAVTGPTVDMVVKNPDGQQATASGAITVDLPPAFANANALTPTHGPASGGTALTLTGSRFSVGAAVKLGNLACTGVSVVSPTQITCTTPPNMPSGPTDVIVKNADGQIATLSGGFTVDAPPSVTSVSPNHGPSGGGTTLTFAGNGFVNGTRIFFGAVECPGVVYESSTQVTCVLPALTAGLFAVKATNPDGQFTTLTGGFTADPPPILISTTPNNGPSSASIIITLAGSNFTTGVSVMIGGQTCTNPARSDNGTSLTCQTPLLPAGPADVVVTNGDGQKATLAGGFTVNGSPLVTSVTPNHGPSSGTQVVTLNGSNFINGASVVFGGSICTNVSVNGPTQISCVTSAHSSGAVAVTVTNPDDQVGTLNNGYTYDGGPTLTILNPQNGPATGGTTVTLTGTNFQSGASVLVGGLNCASVTVVSSTQVTCLTPAHISGSVEVILTNADTQRATLSQGFTFDPAPRINTVTPNHGPAQGNTTVAFEGSSFNGGTVIKIDGTDCHAVLDDSQHMHCVAPAHAAGAVTVFAINVDNQSFTLNPGYTYDPAPSVSLISPVLGLTTGSTAVTITGASFVSGASVNLGGSNCGSVAVVSPTQITCTTTQHLAGVVDVNVINPDTQKGTLIGGFTYALPAPTIASVSPTHGPSNGSTLLTVNGTNYVAGVGISVGGSTCAGVTFISSSQVTCTPPSHGSGIVDVVATNPDTQFSKLTNGYTYDAGPTLSTVTPSNGPDSGGTNLILGGANFVSGAVVKVGGQNCTGVTFQSSIQLSCSAPAYVSGSRSVDIMVVNPDGQTSTMPGAYNYNAPPVLTSLNVIHGPAAGGTALTLTGSGFLSGASVLIGSTPCLSPILVSATSLTCTTPAMTAGIYGVKAKNPDGQLSVAVNFTFDPAPAIATVTPNHGPASGGTAITLAGSGFMTGAVVKIGTGDCQNENVISDTKMTCQTPTGSAGTQGVTVTNTDAQTGMLTNGFTYDPAPVVTGVSPSSVPASIATQITITGQSFQSGVAVDLVGNQSVSCGNVIFDGATQVRCQVSGAMAGLYGVRLTNLDSQTHTLSSAVTVIAAPKVTAITPSHGSKTGGTPVTLTGTGFAALDTVKIGNSTCTGVTIASATSLTCTTSASVADTFAVTVTDSLNQIGALNNGYTYDPPPTIYSFTPLNGPAGGGSPLTFTGTGFQSGIKGVLGGVDCVATGAVTLTSFTCSTGAHTAGVVNVTVVNVDGQSSAVAGNQYTFLAPPSVSSIVPNSGPSTMTTPITINGGDFQGGATVTIGGSNCGNLVFASGSKLTCSAPIHAPGGADVVVTNPDGQKATVLGGFTYTGPPSVTSVTPANGTSAGGTVVTIAGTGFVPGATIDFGGSACGSVNSLTNTSLKCTTTAHASGAVAVKVTNLDTQSGSLASGFTYNPAPTLTSLSPPSGPQTSPVTVIFTGLNFISGMTAKFGSAACANPVFVSSTQFKCDTPVPFAAPGAVSVTLTNPDGQSSTSPSAFTVVPPPTLKSVTPASGPSAGGTLITILGTGFTATTTVFIDNSACIGPITTGTTQVQCVTTSHPNGEFDITVKNSDGQSGTLAKAYTYVGLPLVTAVIPISGPLAGGYPIVVTGFGFLLTPSVLLGAVPCTGVTTVTAGTLRCTVGPSTAGTVDAFVTNPDNQVGQLSDAFTYVSAPKIIAVVPTSGGAVGGRTESLSVAIEGMDFSSTAVAKVNGSPCTSQRVVNPSRIECLIPPGSPGNVPVVVTNPDGQTSNSFNFLFETGTYSALDCDVIPAVSPRSTSCTGNIVATGSLNGIKTAAEAGRLCGAAGNQSGHCCMYHAVNAGAWYLTDSLPQSTGRLCDTALNITCTVGAGLCTSVKGATVPTENTYLFRAYNKNIDDHLYTLNQVEASSTPNYSFEGQAFRVFTQQYVNQEPIYRFYNPVKGIHYYTLNSGERDALVVNGQVYEGTQGFIYPNSAPGLLEILHVYFPGTGGHLFTTSLAEAAASVSLGGQIQTHLGFTFGAVPTVTSLSPASGLTQGGFNVTVIGTGFVPGATVTIGGSACTLPTVTATTTITCKTPALGLGTYPVVVTLPDGQSATLASAYTVYQFSVNPASGPSTGGTELTISGGGFSSPAVTLGGNACAITAASQTTITCITPMHVAGYVALTVTNSDGATVTKPNAFTYYPSPTVTSVSPNTGKRSGGTNVTITGTNFGGGATVTIGGITCASPNVVSSSSITCTTGASNTTGAMSVKVTNLDGQSGTGTNLFTYTPEINLFSPQSGPIAGGTMLTINGIGFSSPTVLLGSNNCPITYSTLTSVACTVPAGNAPRVDVMLTNSNGASVTATTQYAYLAAPTISSINPGSGPTAGGTPVTITGTNFRAGMTAKIGSGNCPISGVINATSVSCVSPPNLPGVYGVTVTNADGTTTTQANSFVYSYPTAPVITAMTPTTGSALGGTLISFQGDGFRSGTIVTIGSVNCGNVVIMSPTSMTCTTAAAADSVNTVSVSVSGGGVGIAPRQFTYTAQPVITSFSPIQASVTGGATLTVAGTGLGNRVTISVGGILCANPTAPLPYYGGTNWSFVQCLLGASEDTGPVPIRLVNPSGTETKTVGDFIYYSAPTITAVNPNAGPANQPTLITVTGTNFINPVAVLGGAQCPIVSGSVLFTQFRCTTPSATKASSPDWPNNIATFSNTGSVNWQDGSSWTAAAPETHLFPRVSVADYTNNFGKQVHLVINETTSAVFVDQNNIFHKGTYTAPTQLNSSDYPNNPANFTFGRVTWGDGTVWTQNPDLNSPIVVKHYLNSTQPAITRTAHFIQTGSTQVYFINELGNWQVGTMTSSTTAIVPGWGNKVATISASSITWSDGSVWVFSATSSPNPIVVTDYTTRSNILGSDLLPDHLIQDGSLTAGFVSVQGGVVLGTFNSPTQATVPAWGNDVATIVNGRISWSDGNSWIPDTSSPSPLFLKTYTTNYSGQSGRPTAIVQNGTVQLLFVDGLNSFHLGSFLPGTQVGAVPLTVTNATGGSATLNNAYTYQTPTASITSVSPASGAAAGGNVITVAGTNFISSSTVKLGTVASGYATCNSVQFVSSTQLVCKTLAHAAGIVDVVVTNGSPTNAVKIGGFTYVNQTVNGINCTVPAWNNPATSCTGAVISSGTMSDFDDPATAALRCSAANNTAGSCCMYHLYGTGMWYLTEGVPQNIGRLCQTESNGTLDSCYAGGACQPITRAPSIQSITPNAGGLAGGTLVTLTGSGFTGVTNVNFDGVTCGSVSVASDTQLTCLTGPHLAGTVQANVKSPGGTGNLPNAYTYGTSITSISPSSGSTAGGTTVTIYGTGFLGFTSVNIGGSQCVSPSFIGATQVTCVTTAHAAGAASVTVTAAIGSATLNSAFTYANPAPTISSVSPTQGGVPGGTVLTITGTRLTGASSVSLGGTVCTGVTVLSDSQVRCTTGAHANGAVTVNVTTPGGTVNYSSFTYNTALTSVSPTSGPTSGGTVIIFSGTGFTGLTNLFISAPTVASCAAKSFISDTQMTCTTPAYPTAGLASFNVSYSLGQMTIAYQKFTFVAPAPPTVNLSISASASGPFSTTATVPYNSMGYIQWTSANATSCLYSPVGWTDLNRPISAVGPLVTNPTLAAVTCQGPGGSTTKTVSFTVAPAPPTVNLSISASASGPFSTTATVPYNSMGYIQWTSANATSCLYSPVGWTDLNRPVSAVGPLVTNPTPATVTCKGPGGSTTKTVNFTVAPAPPTVNLSISASASGPFSTTATVPYNSMGYIQWTSANATSCVYSPVGWTDLNRPVSAVGPLVTNPTPATVTCKGPGGSTTKTVNFTVLSSGPTITTFFPPMGQTLGGGKLEVQGTGFQSGAIVKVGNSSCSTTFLSSTVLRCGYIPSGAGSLPVSVTNPGGGTATGPFNFTYTISPYVYSISPSSGPTAGGTLIFLEGANLKAGTTITIGGVPCVAPSLSGYFGSCMTPASTTVGNKTVVIGSYSHPFGFTYTNTTSSGACASWTQVSHSCGDPNNYEWSGLWAPALTGLTNGGDSSLAQNNWATRIGDANWGVCGRAPGTGNTYHTYPVAGITVGGTNYKPMTIYNNGTYQNMGTAQCPAYFSMNYSPLIVDIRGEGIGLSAPSDGIAFDILGEGYKNQISWPTNADNSLVVVLDRNQDSKIDSIHELFGNNTVGPDGQKAKNGFEALAKYDANRDGVIDYRDSIYDDLRLWSDKNRNGKVDQGELTTLTNRHVRLIDLAYANIHERNDYYGNESLQRSVVALDSKELRRIYDVWFAPGMRVKEPSLAELETLEEIHNRLQKDELIAAEIVDKLKPSSVREANRVPASEVDPIRKNNLLQMPIFKNNLDLAKQEKMRAEPPIHLAVDHPLVQRAEPAPEGQIISTVGRSTVTESIVKDLKRGSASKILWLMLGLALVAGLVTLLIRRRPPIE